MQVHAVPDSERATDSNGRKLPWAFDYADSENTQQRRVPEEKGPFGKARKRGTSRTRTSTPARGEDKAKLENLRYMDDIFTKQKIQEETRQKETLRLRKPSGQGSLPVSASAPNLIEIGGLVPTSFQGNASANGPVKEPTEVMLWGYGNDVQWAAIDHYERVSGGIIFEEYERNPSNGRYNLSISHQRASHLKSLSVTWMRKINAYVGGDHWIKVTFDSPEAAERACHYSPHPIQGYMVSAQRYVGRGPIEDVAVPASGGSRVVSTAGSPNYSSSATLSSRTATNSEPARRLPRSKTTPFLRASGAWPEDDSVIENLDSTSDDRTLLASQENQISTSASTTSSQPRKTGRSTLRVKGAKPAVLLPQEKAFLPAASRWQQTFGSWPVIGWVIGSNHGIIGDQVPRKEDGSFDSNSAGLYWRLWYSVDSCFGTDFCGLRDAEYDE